MQVDLPGLRDGKWYGVSLDEILEAFERVEDVVTSGSLSLSDTEEELFEYAGGVLRVIHDQVHGIVRDEKTGEILESR